MENVIAFTLILAVMTIVLPILAVVMIKWFTWLFDHFIK